MHRMVKNLTKVLCLFTIHQFFWSTIGFSDPPDFIDHDGPHGMPVLRQALKIPVGHTTELTHKNSGFSRDDHNPFIHNTYDIEHHVTLPEGTPLHEIPAKVSQKREEVGLPPQISPDQRDIFFQYDWLHWQSSRNIVEKAKVAGRVTTVDVRKGNQVQRKDRLCIVEFMKFYCNFVAPFSGNIQHVFIKVGDIVEIGSLLVELTSAPGWHAIPRSQILKFKVHLLPFFPWAMPQSSPTPAALPASQKDDQVKQGDNRTVPNDIPKLNPLPHPLTAEVNPAPLAALPPAPLHFPPVTEEKGELGQQTAPTTFVSPKALLGVASPPERLNLPKEVPLPQPESIKEAKQKERNIETEKKNSQTLRQEILIPRLLPKADEKGKGETIIEDSRSKLKRVISLSPLWIRKQFHVPVNGKTVQVVFSESNILYLNRNSYKTRGLIEPYFSPPIIHFFKPIFESRSYQYLVSSLRYQPAPGPRLRLETVSGSCEYVTKFENKSSTSRRLKINSICKSCEESDFSISNWAKWIGSLICLCNLIFAFKTLIYYKLNYMSLRQFYVNPTSLPPIRYLQAIEMNTQKYIKIQSPYNVNDLKWAKKTINSRC